MCDGGAECMSWCFLIHSCASRVSQGCSRRMITGFHSLRLWKLFVLSPIQQSAGFLFAHENGLIARIDFLMPSNLCSVLASGKKSSPLLEEEWHAGRLALV